MKKLLYAILAISMLMLCSCAKRSDIPDVYCQDGVIYLNDKVLDESDTLVIKRIDNSIISIWTGEKYINVTPDGTVLTLSDLIVDKEAYEEGIKEIVDWQLSVRNSVGPTQEQYEEIMNVLSSYDETVKLDFCVNDLSITIFAPYVSVRLDYDCAFIAEKYNISDFRSIIRSSEKPVFIKLVYPFVALYDIFKALTRDTCIFNTELTK